MAIKDLIEGRNQKNMIAAMEKMANSKPQVNVTPTVQWPANAEVTVKNQVEEVKVNNLGDVVRAISLLAQGFKDIKGAVDALDLEVPDKEVQEVAGRVEVDTSVLEKKLDEIGRGLASLTRVLDKLPQETKVDFPDIVIPKSFSVENWEVVTKGLKAINDNVVGLAKVIGKQPNIEIPKTDNESLEKAVKSVEKAIRGLMFPEPPGSTPAFKDSSGQAISVTPTSGGQVPTDLRRGQTIEFAAVNAAGSGDNTVVPLVASKKIKVLSYVLVCNGTVDVTWKSGASTSLSGAMPFVANTGVSSHIGSPAQGWLLETAAGEALILNLSGAVGVRGHLSYFSEA